MTAVIRNALAFAHASETLQTDSSFVVAALEEWASLSKMERQYHYRKYGFGKYGFDSEVVDPREITWVTLLLHDDYKQLYRIPPNVREDLLGRRPELCRRAAKAFPWLYLSDGEPPTRPASIFRACDLLKEPAFLRIVLEAACLELAADVAPPRELDCCQFRKFVEMENSATSSGSWIAEPNFQLLILTGCTLSMEPGTQSDLFTDDAAVLDAFRRADRETVLWRRKVLHKKSYHYDTRVWDHSTTAPPPPRRDEAVEKLFASHMEECHDWSKEAVLDFLPDYPYLFFLLPTEELREDEDILRRVLELDDDNFIFNLLPENHKMHQDKQVVTQAVKRRPGSLLALDRSSPFWTDEDVLAVFREGCPNPMDTFVHYPAVVELTRI
eukprot:g10266.t1